MFALKINQLNKKIVRMRLHINVFSHLYLNDILVRSLLMHFYESIQFKETPIVRIFQSLEM